MTDDGQRFAPSVDGRVKLAARMQVMRQGKLLADYHLVISPRLHQSTAAQEYLVQQAAAVVRQRQQVATDRVIETRHIEIDISHHTGFHLVHPGNFPDAFDQGQRGAFEGGEDLGKMMISIISFARLV